MVIKTFVMKKIFDIYAWLLFLVIFASCSEVNLLHPYGEDDGVPPGPVSDISVRNWSGAATIKYSLPKDKDLAYVKAEFEGTNGQKREVRASGYVDSLVIDGFGDTRDYSVTLRSFDKFENASEPVEVTVTPEIPPIQKVFESLSYQIDFGGFIVSFENETKSEVAIYILNRDTITMEMGYYDAYYTEQAKGQYAVRGLPAVENEFGIYVRDRWDNVSDTLYFTGTPWREDELDRSGFTYVSATSIPGDVTWSGYMGNPVYMWDGEVGNGNFGHTEYPVPFPHRLTVDLGVKAKLSRIRTWQRPGDDVQWQHGAWKKFNIYGCVELPSTAAMQEDPLNGWTLLGSFESIKPSGLPLGQVSDEDMQLLADGEEFVFGRDVTPIRYIRFEVLMSWSGMECSVLSEFRLWGEIEETYY